MHSLIKCISRSVLLISITYSCSSHESESYFADVPYNVDKLENKTIKDIWEDSKMIDEVRRARQAGRRIYVKTWRDPKGVEAAADGIQREGIINGIKRGFPHSDVLELGVSQDQKTLQFLSQAGQNYGAFLGLGKDEKQVIDRRNQAVGMLNSDQGKKDVERWQIVDAVAVPGKAGSQLDNYLKTRDKTADAVEYDVISNNCITNANKNFSKLEEFTKSIEPSENKSQFNMAAKSTQTPQYASKGTHNTAAPQPQKIGQQGPPTSSGSQGTQTAQTQSQSASGSSVQQ